MKRNILTICLIIIIVACSFMIGYRIMKNNEKPKEKVEENKVTENLDFNSYFIRETNKLENGNYLVSPYSVEIALNMLKEGSNGETKAQIEKVIENRNINFFNIKNRINVANAMFIKNEYKNNVKDAYYKTIKENYKSEILYDDFKTPKVMNDWVNKETYGMIDNIFSETPDNFIMGIANAIAIDVDWNKKFDCSATSKKEFTKSDNTKIETPMMYEKYVSDDYKYLVTEKEKVAVLPYMTYDESGKETYSESDDHLEFVGILPNGDINSYVENITKEKLNEIDNNLNPSTDKLNLSVALPMFKYDYDMSEKFQTVLNNMGIKDVFDSEKADLSNMIDIKNTYLEKAIHKTHIDLNEKGTKAAAVTALVPIVGSVYNPEKPEVVEIEFNKPFIYIIRDKKTNEMLFFGVVQEPSKWQGETCSEQNAA